MKDVITKIQELYSLLQQNKADVESQSNRISTLKAEAEDERNKQVSITNMLNAKVRILEKKEAGLVPVEEKLAKREKAVAKDIEHIDCEKKVKEREEAVAKKEKYFDELVAVYKQKVINNDNLKVQLETERKLMKENILKELGAKLDA